MTNALGDGARRSRATCHTSPSHTLPWICVADRAPYFVTEDGEPWTPIGQNDGISWDDLAGLYRRRDVAAVEGYLEYLVASGVTCLRLMLECAYHRRRYFERPAGVFVPALVQLWDDLFRLCEQFGLRILLTPIDTFWTCLRWEPHPYNSVNGGPLDLTKRWLLDVNTRAAIKNRLDFVIRRWGASGAFFAWDLWNEIHPAHAQDQVDPFHDFIADLSQHVRDLETELYGRSHLQTVSVFGPELVWKPHFDIASPIFRHPDLDFATIHIYEEGTIDFPKDTVVPAIAMGNIVRDSIAPISDIRPMLDTENRPIHALNDHRVTLPEAFDDEYFRHMQWAHLASGGVGGGMRWPYRYPHRLTAGMRVAQRAMADFLPLIDWPRLRRRNLDVRLSGATSEALATFACGDRHQAVVWCLRRDTLDSEGRLRRDASPISPVLTLSGFEPGAYTVTCWHTEKGGVLYRGRPVVTNDGLLLLDVPGLVTDAALAIVPAQH